MAKFSHLENVEEAASAYPDSFFIPNPDERKAQKMGDPVKLHFVLVDDGDPDEPRAERMWVSVTEELGTSGVYKGRLESNPHYITDLQFGDEITFEPCHIAQTIIKPGDPRWIDSADKMALISQLCLEDGNIVRFLYRQETDREEDSGWRMFSGMESEEYNADSENIAMKSVGFMISRDPTLLEPLKGEIGSVFERKSVGGPWNKVTDWDFPD